MSKKNTRNSVFKTSKKTIGIGVLNIFLFLGMTLLVNALWIPPKEYLIYVALTLLILWIIYLPLARWRDKIRKKHLGTPKCKKADFIYRVAQQIAHSVLYGMFAIVCVETLDRAKNHMLEGLMPNAHLTIFLAVLFYIFSLLVVFVSFFNDFEIIDPRESYLNKTDTDKDTDNQKETLDNPS